MGEEKVRRFTFTWFNYEDKNEKEKLNCLITGKFGKINYIIYGKEISPTTNKPHLQGYVEFVHPKLFKQLIKQISPTHIEIAKSKKEFNIEYCKKDGNWTEFGNTPNESEQGKRSDLETIKYEIINNGKQVQQILDLITNPQQLRFAEGLVKYAPQAKRNNVHVRWYWGPSGSGKTKTAYEEFPDAWISSGDFKFWNGYYGQKQIILDDLRHDDIKYNILLRILDGYPFTVNIKGTHTALMAETIIITSTKHPLDTFFELDEDPTQLTRRINEIRSFKHKAQALEVEGVILDPSTYEAT